MKNDVDFNKVNIFYLNELIRPIIIQTRDTIESLKNLTKNKSSIFKIENPKIRLKCLKKLDLLIDATLHKIHFISSISSIQNWN